MATGFSYERERRAEQAEIVRALLPQVRDIRRAGAAALDLAWLAAGRVDAFYERGLKAWDRAAGELLVREAGGAVVTLEGEPPGVVAAATPALLEALEPLVRLAPLRRCGISSSAWRASLPRSGPGGHRAASIA